LPRTTRLACDWVRADYCGDGIGNTRNGTPIELVGIRLVLGDGSKRQRQIRIDAVERDAKDFAGAKIVENLDQRSASFVSVTQQFNTTTSMGRLTLNLPHTIDLI
jgi:site-specific DNA recombinase